MGFGFSTDSVPISIAQSDVPLKEGLQMDIDDLFGGFLSAVSAAVNFRRMFGVRTEVPTRVGGIGVINGGFGKYLLSRWADGSVWFTEMLPEALSDIPVTYPFYSAPVGDEPMVYRDDAVATLLELSPYLLDDVVRMEEAFQAIFARELPVVVEGQPSPTPATPSIYLKETAAGGRFVVIRNGAGVDNPIPLSLYSGTQAPVWSSAPPVVPMSSPPFFDYERWGDDALVWNEMFSTLEGVLKENADVLLGVEVGDTAIVNSMDYASYQYNSNHLVAIDDGLSTFLRYGEIDSFGNLLPFRVDSGGGGGGGGGGFPPP